MEKKKKKEQKKKQRMRHQLSKLHGFHCEEDFEF